MFVTAVPLTKTVAWLSIVVWVAVWGYVAWFSTGTFLVVALAALAIVPIGLINAFEKAGTQRRAAEVAAYRASMAQRAAEQRQADLNAQAMIEALRGESGRQHVTLPPDPGSWR